MYCTQTPVYGTITAKNLRHIGSQDAHVRYKKSRRDNESARNHRPTHGFLQKNILYIEVHIENLNAIFLENNRENSLFSLS